MSVYEKAREAASFLKSRLPADLQKPQAAVVCGSGLSGLANTVEAEPRAEFDFASIPHFPRPTGNASNMNDEETSSSQSCSNWPCW